MSEIILYWNYRIFEFEMNVCGECLFFVGDSVSVFFLNYEGYGGVVIGGVLFVIKFGWVDDYGDFRYGRLFVVFEWFWGGDSCVFVMFCIMIYEK